jgi:hypothetical protein
VPGVGDDDRIHVGGDEAQAIGLRCSFSAEIREVFEVPQPAPRGGSRGC